MKTSISTPKQHELKSKGLFSEKNPWHMPRSSKESISFQSRKKLDHFIMKSVNEGAPIAQQLSRYIISHHIVSH